MNGNQFSAWRQKQQATLLFQFLGPLLVRFVTIPFLPFIESFPPPSLIMLSSLTASLLSLSLLTSSVLSIDPRIAALQKRQSTSTSAAGYAQPSSWLTVIPDSNLGEPINVVISNASSSAVLSDPSPYFSSLFFSPNNCLGLNLGDAQAANLNDGQGTVNQTGLYRYNFNEGISTCEESIEGGEHFR